MFTALFSLQMWQTFVIFILTVQDAVNSERSHTSMSVHRCRRCFHSYRFTNASFLQPRTAKNRLQHKVVLYQTHTRTQILTMVIIDKSSFMEYVNRNLIREPCGSNQDVLLNPGCDSLGSSMSSSCSRLEATWMGLVRYHIESSSLFLFTPRTQI